MTLVHGSTMTPMGRFGWLRGTRGVVASGWDVDAAYLRTLAARCEPVEEGEDPETAAAVEGFFAGDPTALDVVVVDQHGGLFVQQAWAALRRIPIGETLTYTELAAAAGRPSAVRAAASACATNRTALFVPCHRVVRSDGGLGGFRYGTDVKRALLGFEGQLAGR